MSALRKTLVFALLGLSLALSAGLADARIGMMDPPIWETGSSTVSQGNALGDNDVYLPVVLKQHPSLSGQRAVNIPYFSSPGSGTSLNDSQWTQSAIFWFGKNEQTLPGLNYADVRMAYTNYGLHVRVTPIDYYLWYTDVPDATIDLTQWDSIALYFDTSFDRAAQPRTDDYTFMAMGRVWVNPGNPTQYRREARGDGSGWDSAWSGAWEDWYGGVWWEDPGWNYNGASKDFGADVGFSIPWATFGRSGPPVDGALWGLGVALYDRDSADTSGILPPEYWPETFDPNQPGTWGGLHFGPARYTPSAATPEGTTEIRARTLTSTTSDNTVEDAWIGGGGNCSGGHEGGNETNHGDDTSLFVASQASSADFPCFSRSYLRFSLAAVPAGKTIISATLRLSHWGNPLNQAAPSWVHLFTIVDPWQEMTIHWNNAPLAKENIAAAWVYPRLDTSLPPYGDPYYWDATQAVAEAHAQGQSVNVAVYSSDTGFDSSKYLGSSEAYDMYIQNRPLLSVTWGSP